MAITEVKLQQQHASHAGLLFPLCRSEDDLTHKLSEIVKANIRLGRMEQSGAPQHIIQEFAQLLQFHITTYIDNTVPGQPVAQQRSGRPIKSISQRLKVRCLGYSSCITTDSNVLDRIKYRSGAAPSCATATAYACQPQKGGRSQARLST